MAVFVLGRAPRQREIATQNRVRLSALQGNPLQSFTQRSTNFALLGMINLSQIQPSIMLVLLALKA